MRIALLTVTAAVVLAGCGSSEPRLARTDAQALQTLTARIAREGACAQARDIAAVRDRAIRLKRQSPGWACALIIEQVRALAGASPNPGYTSSIS